MAGCGIITRSQKAQSSSWASFVRFEAGNDLGGFRGQAYFPGIIYLMTIPKCILDVVYVLKCLMSDLCESWAREKCTDVAWE